MNIVRLVILVLWLGMPIAPLLAQNAPTTPAAPLTSEQNQEQPSRSEPVSVAPAVPQPFGVSREILERIIGAGLQFAAWFGSEFWAAVAGAVIGGFISFKMQRAATKATKEQREDERLLTRKALAHSLLFKMMRIESNIVSFDEHLASQLKRVQLNQRASSSPWSVVQPFASLPEVVNFNSDEMGLLLSLKDTQLFNEVLGFDDLHNSMIGNFSIYRERRFALTAQMPATKSGDQWLTALSKSDLQKLDPLMHELDELVLEMQRINAEEASRAKQVLAGLNTLFNLKLGLGLTLADRKGGPLIPVS